MFLDVSVDTMATIRYPKWGINILQQDKVEKAAEKNRSQIYFLRRELKNTVKGSERRWTGVSASFAWTRISHIHQSITIFLCFWAQMHRIASIRT